VSLPHIAGDLSSSQDESTWVLTSYLVTNAVVMPISGWLSNTFGRKRFFLACIAGFTASSLLCGLAPNLATLILLRAIQGATGGGLQPAGQAILADSFPGEKRGMATAIYGIATVFAPTIGPTLGGFITDSYNWRWIFLINVPVGIVLFFLVTALIHEKSSSVVSSGKKFSVDWFGFGFVALSLGCLQIVMDRGQQDDWFYSDTITALTVTSALAFVLLIRWELRHKEPIVDLRLMRDPDFAVSFGLMLMLGFMLLGSTYLIPAYVQSLMGYRAVDAGMVLTPGGLATIALLPLVGRSMNKVDLRLLVAIGLIIGGSSLLWMTHFYLDMSFKQIMLARMAQAASLPFLVILTRREQFHQSRLTEHLQSMNPAYPDFANQIGSVMGGGANAATTLANIYQGAVQQATLLAYLDDFKMLGLLFLGLLPFLLLVKAGKGSGGPAVGH
jgi:DHA2 family multidrug resistance protein